MIHIRPSRDHRLIARLNEEVQNLHHQMYPHIFKPYDQKGIEAFMKTMFSEGGAEALVAWSQDQAVAYLVYRVLEQKETSYKYADRVIYIDQIHVDQGMRKTGLGKALLEEVKQIGRRHKVSAIQLDHWSANDGARAFFGKNGFQYFQEKMTFIFFS